MRPSPASLAFLVVLGVLGALWSLLLWAELVVSRASGTPSCPLGGGSGCAALWDSAFASAVHGRTGLPVAAWGLAWGLVALALPLAALVRAAQGRPRPALVSAARFAAAAGLIGVFVMLAVSGSEGAICGSCALFYLLVGGYAGIALFGWPGVGLPERGRAATLFGGATLLALTLLLYPGSRTPRPVGPAGREAITSQAPLEELVASLSPGMKQTLSDSLSIYRRSPSLAAPAPRALEGTWDAPVRISEFTDVRCEHCAELHRTLASLRENLPADSFSVDSRQFPLDGECNPFVTAKGRDPVRCLAARARICLEGTAGASAFAGALFENQETLTAERVFALAAPHLARARLRACLDSPETRRKLEDDVAFAARFDPDGTPIVVVNGRRGTSFPPFLYAIVLTRGTDSHAAFASLPPPNPAAHLH